MLIAEPRIKSGSANPAPKLTTLIAGMCAGADGIDDIDVLRSGGMKTVFGGVYAPSTVGTLLRSIPTPAPGSRMPRSPKPPTPLSRPPPTAITARLVVRRVKDARYRDALFPVWRYHPFFTNTDLPIAEADITHRRHAIIETTFADLIDGPLAHLPVGYLELMIGCPPRA